MTSIHVQRLEDRRSRTAHRIVDYAARNNLSPADMRDVRLPWYEIRNQAAGGSGDADEPATILIYDEIGGSFGVTAKQFAADLEAITAPEIRVRINSPGGSVFDAIAIHSSLLHHPARIVVYVDSLAASAASVIAMAGDEIVMMPGSQLMIHEASALVDGNADEMTKMSTFLDRQSANIADMYRLRGGGGAAEWRDLMKAETWMFAAESVEAGLADRVEERARPEGADDEADEAMTRAFDLSTFGYRYHSREQAPEPPRRKPRPVTAGRRTTKPTPEPAPEPEQHTQFTRAFLDGGGDWTAEPAGTPIPFTASTPGVKRDGLDLRAEGWLVDHFLANPVVLWAHNHTAPPIGRAGAAAENSRLRMPVTFDQEDPFARKLESKYRRGFLHAVSVGWDFTDGAGQPIAWWRLTPDEIRDRAFYDLTELSGVPVPSDPAALAERQRSALRHFGRQLVDLFDDIEREDGQLTAPQVQQALLDECVRLGIPLDLNHWRPLDQAPAPVGEQPATEDHPPAPAGVDQDAARSILAAFNLGGIQP